MVSASSSHFLLPCFIVWILALCQYVASDNSIFFSSAFAKLRQYNFCLNQIFPLGGILDAFNINLPEPIWCLAFLIYFLYELLFFICTFSWLFLFCNLWTLSWYAKYLMKHYLHNTDGFLFVTHGNISDGSFFTHGIRGDPEIPRWICLLTKDWVSCRHRNPTQTLIYSGFIVKSWSQNGIYCSLIHDIVSFCIKCFMKLEHEFPGFL